MPKGGKRAGSGRKCPPVKHQYTFWAPIENLERFKTFVPKYYRSRFIEFALNRELEDYVSQRHPAKFDFMEKPARKARK